jgi:hypothetical protein
VEGVLRPAIIAVNILVNASQSGASSCCWPHLGLEKLTIRDFAVGTAPPQAPLIVTSLLRFLVTGEF